MFGTPAVRAAGGLPFPGISWRLLLGIGALPGLLLLPFKATPSKAATDASAARAKGKEGGKPPLSLLQALKIRRYWPKLVGTAGGWFLFDITFYGNSLFAPTVLKVRRRTRKTRCVVCVSCVSCVRVCVCCLSCCDILCMMLTLAWISLLSPPLFPPLSPSLSPPLSSSLSLLLPVFLRPSSTTTRTRPPSPATRSRTTSARSS